MKRTQKQVKKPQTSKRRIVTPEILAAFQNAVKCIEMSWDSQRDVEMQLGCDIEDLGTFAEDCAVIGWESVDAETLESFINEGRESI